ncbi:MAG TPA: hypothetical protein VKQ52_03765, partial [Puia sp.]|nr:hypothetical protein [Puia sp.]
MIVVLALRFRKHIALFLYVVLYSQLVMAAEVLRAGHGGTGNSPSWEMSDAGYYPAWRELNEIPEVIGDSGVIPARKAAGDVAASPSFRLPATPMAVNKSAKEFIGGPSQPEMSSFQSVNSNNMV